jgi:hypothetical protein
MILFQCIEEQGKRVFANENQIISVPPKTFSTVPSTNAMTLF